MKQNSSLAMVRELMSEFADLTGLSPAKTSQRYLWTDAFAVCNFLELYGRTKDEAYRNLALRLVDRVHAILGRHRQGDPRAGWISGLDEEEGKTHPTRGGLRIGKDLTERSPTDPFKENLEWDQDGQYFHYLTKWMHALHRVGSVTGDTTYYTWAVELAKAAHAGFSYSPSSGGRKRMYWKMSIDLSRPLVESMGHHDPLDGLITYHQLQSSGTGVPEKNYRPNLEGEIADMADICLGKSWITDDPLGIGGLLCDINRVAQMIVYKDFERIDLLETLLDAAQESLQYYAKANSLTHPADYRLAFRELGLSIGLRALEKLPGLLEKKPGLFEKGSPSIERIDILKQFSPLTEIIEGFWLKRTNRETDVWMEHRHINMVMLATSLAPDGFNTV
ncbi:MAG: hypothetical protein GY866_30300 [Proteobacteria bacterium]|nr:hypothetical protein [Pseudomonadota bacterium]